MKIAAKLENSLESNKVTLQTNGIEQELSIPGKSNGRGSSVNGGEFLMLSLATCFCDASDEELRSLIAHTDKVAEIQNTFRSGVSVTLLSKD